MKQYLSIIIGLCIICIACNKEEVVQTPLCEHIPCSDTTEYYGNKVALNPNYRIGKWIDLREISSSKATLTFHTDSTFTHVNEDGNGIVNGKYAFDYIYFELYENYGNEILEDPIRKETTYNDTTGVFSIKNQVIIGTNGSDNYQHWGHYVKVE